MEHAAAFSLSVGATVLGQLVERDGVLSFKAQHGGVLDEDALRRGGIRLSMPTEGPASAELIALRDLCLRKGIKAALGQLKDHLS